MRLGQALPVSSTDAHQPWIFAFHFSNSDPTFSTPANRQRPLRISRDCRSNYGHAALRAQLFTGGGQFYSLGALTTIVPATQLSRMQPLARLSPRTHSGGWMWSRGRSASSWRERGYSGLAALVGQLGQGRQCPVAVDAWVGARRSALTSSYVSPQRRCPARLDGRDHLGLAEAHVSLVGSDPRRSMGAEYVPHLHGLSCQAGNGLIRPRCQTSNC